MAMDAMMDAGAEAAAPAGPELPPKLMALLKQLMEMMGQGAPGGMDVSRNQEAAQLTDEDAGAPMPPMGNPTVGAPAGPMDGLKAAMGKLKGKMAPAQ